MTPSSCNFRMVSLKISRYGESKEKCKSLDASLKSRNSLCGTPKPYPFESRRPPIDVSSQFLMILYSLVVDLDELMHGEQTYDKVDILDEKSIITGQYSIDSFRTRSRADCCLIRRYVIPHAFVSSNLRFLLTARNRSDRWETFRFPFLRGKSSPLNHPAEVRRISSFARRDLRRSQSEFAYVERSEKPLREEEQQSTSRSAVISLLPRLAV